MTTSSEQAAAIRSPTTAIAADYLMTLHAPGDPPLMIDPALTIYRTGTDGWVAGPRLKGRILQPSCDWLQVTPQSVLKVDVRMILALDTDKADEPALVYVSYGGVIDMQPDVFARLQQGEQLTAADLYFVIAPSFRTAHADYLWLNRLQAIGRMTALQFGAGSFVRYEIFAVT